ncbi:11672_t:CDS:2 [Entrophospora sp. SA101]|nr:11672_t:CDS:2 [Entrophospora sp. SA101]
MSATLPDIPKGACWDFVANFSDDSVEELLNKLSHDNSWKRMKSGKNSAFRFEFAKTLN